MKDALTILKEVEKKYGTQFWVDNFKCGKGHYFLVEDSNILNYEKINLKTEQTGLDYFRERVFYEGLVFNDTNKSVDSNKKIHSSTSNAIICKYSTLKLKDISNLLNSHFSKMKEYIPNLEIETLVEEFSNYINKILVYLEELAPDANDKIYILKNIDKTKYIEEYEKYLQLKIFNKDSITFINDEKYGVLSYCLNENKKKPFLKNNLYGEKSFKINYEDAKRILFLSKLDNKSIEKILGDNITYELDFKSHKIIDYKISEKKEDVPKKKCGIVTLFTPKTNFSQLYQLEKEMTRDDIRQIIDIKLLPNNKKYEKNKFMLSNLLLNNMEDKTYYNKSLSSQIGGLFIVNKEILQFYFLENKEIDITNIIENILTEIFYYLLINTKTETTLFELNYVLNRIFTILSYLDKKERFTKIMMDIKTINKNLTDFCVNKRDTIEINDDGTFWFAGGQLLQYLSNLTKSKHKNEAITMQDSFIVKDSKQLKDMLILKLQTYAYTTNLSSRFKKIFAAILNYRINENFKFNNYKYYYYSGLIGDNIMYLKNAEKTTIVDQPTVLN